MIILTHVGTPEILCSMHSRMQITTLLRHVQHVVSQLFMQIAKITLNQKGCPKVIREVEAIKLS